MTQKGGEKRGVPTTILYPQQSLRVCFAPIAPIKSKYFAYSPNQAARNEKKKKIIAATHIHVYKEIYIYV